MKIALCPLNPTIGDVFGNIDKMIPNIEEAIAAGCDMVVFPELSLVGYPPKDYLFYTLFYEQQPKVLIKIKKYSKKIAIVLGLATKNKGPGRPFKNELVVINNGQIASYAKQLLPNYDVFDEARYFEPGTEPLILKIGGKKVGFTICEDIWSGDAKLKARYHHDPLKAYVKAKLDYLINISASPFELNKKDRRNKILHDVARRLNCTVAYVNQLGANDDLIFDGGASVHNSHGKAVAKQAEFNADMLIYDSAAGTASALVTEDDETTSLFKALTLGIKDYVHKTGFTKIVLGLSGGIDSAVVACLAAVALGKENVLGVMLPSRYSSEGSVTDSQQLAANLGIKTQLVPIENIHSEYEKSFTQIFSGMTSDLTAQNVQARIRGNLLMAIANNSGSLLLNTTNKSEMAMGYGTLYGDMCGALAVISDLTKEQVYEVAGYINRAKEIIPTQIIKKEPSAELKPNQKDADTLPPYTVLDPFVVDIIENQNVNSKMSYPHLDANCVLKTMLINEYKRHQAPLGLKVSEKAFGSGRRMPIAAKLL